MNDTDVLILKSIISRTKKEGFAPTVREIAEDVGIAPSNVSVKLRNMKLEGLVDNATTSGNKYSAARTLRLTEYGKEVLAKKP